MTLTVCALCTLLIEANHQVIIQDADEAGVFTLHDPLDQVCPQQTGYIQVIPFVVPTLIVTAYVREDESVISVFGASRRPALIRLGQGTCWLSRTEQGLTLPSGQTLGAALRILNDEAVPKISNREANTQINSLYAEVELPDGGLFLTLQGGCENDWVWADGLLLFPGERAVRASYSTEDDAPSEP